jgi:ribosomal protein S18 acetylase RimI-like enzyme
VKTRDAPVIRRATGKDIAAILRLAQKIYRFHARLDPARFGVRRNLRTSYRNWLNRLLRDPRAIVLVAERRARVVAYLVGSVEEEIPVYWQPECGWIHDLWVEPALRHAGLAREMTRRALYHFRAQGQKQVRVQTWIRNKPAQRLFAASGFRDATLEMLIELDGLAKRRRRS